MSSFALPIQNLAARANSSVERADQIHRSVTRSQFWLSAVCYLPTLGLLHGLCGSLAKVVKGLTSGVLDSASADDLRRAAHDLSQIHGRINRLLGIYSKVGIRQAWPYGSLLGEIEQQNDHLASIAEGIYMALDPEFQDLMADALGELSGPERDRSSPLAEMHR